MASRAEIFLVLLLAGSVSVAAQDGGALVALNHPLQLPDMFEDSHVTNSFVLSNSSSRPVEIQNVRATCGCTFTRAETNLVPPRDKVRILFGFHSGQRPDVVERKSIFVITAEQRLTLTFQAAIVPLFKPRTHQIDFGEMPGADRQESLVREFVFDVHPSCGDVQTDSLSGFNADYLDVRAQYDKALKTVKAIVTLRPRLVPTPFLNNTIVFNLRCGDAARTLPVRVTGSFKD